MSLLSLVLPTIGQPDSTEDPKVNNAFAAIVNWANGSIDQSNISSAKGLSPLHWTSQSSNYSASNGDLVEATAGITVTLPAPVINTLVGVWASSQLVNVTASSGLIYAPGWVGVASIPVRFGGGLVVQGAGTNWVTIGGVPDSGWGSFGFANGWANGGGPAPGNTVGFRKTGNVVRLGGVITGGVIGAQAVGMPAGYAPAYDQLFVQETSWTTFGVVIVSHTGAVTPEMSSGTAICFDGITFTVD
jgi:hypothetical protein